MKKYRMQFYGDEEEIITINEAEFNAVKELIDKKKFLFIRGGLIAVSSIRRISKVKQEPIGLPEPLGKLPDSEFLKEHKEKITKKFTWPQVDDEAEKED